MITAPPTSARRWRRRLAWGATTAVLTLALVALALPRLEENDAFCTACHTAPETTYVARAQAARTAVDAFAVPDLAAYHHWRETDFRCIDCHRGDDSALHRRQTARLALVDAIVWLSGQADASLDRANLPNVDPRQQAWVGAERYSRTPELLDAACIKCHAEALAVPGFANHFHNRLPVAQTDNVALTTLACLDCHRAHVAGFESEFYLDENRVVLPACVRCHQEAGRGPLDLLRSN